MIKRLIAIAFIFACCSIAWMVLGGTVVHRTETSGAAVQGALGGMWGGPLVQEAPAAVRLDERPQTVQREVLADDGRVQTVAETVAEEVRTPVPLAGSDVRAEISLEHRKKGLMWHPTYTVGFEGRYRVRNEGEEAARFAFAFPLPDGAPVLSDLALAVDGRVLPVEAEGGRVGHTLDLEPGEAVEVRVRYGSQGVGTWRYALAPGGYRSAEVEPASAPGAAPGVRTSRDVRLTLTTDFANVDFPEGTLSPTAKARDGRGWRLVWDYGTLVASADLGVAMPQRLNPGPWVSRVTFFAPVSLFLFFFAVFVLSLLRGVRLHPMHYFFLGAACFAFHLLLAYLVDHVAVGAAMLAASAASLGLVVSYVRLVAGARFAVVEVGGAHLVYLVAFAATFFLEGFTGLAITLLSVATLFVTMQATGRLDWEAVLARPESAGPDGEARRKAPVAA